jgi:hypothetical protein
MNKERLIKLAKKLESPEAAAHFNLGEWFAVEGDSVDSADEPVSVLIKKCGTTACIAGWAVAMFMPDKSYGSAFFFENGKEALELNYNEARALFLGIDLAETTGMCMMDVTPIQAASVIRHLVDTGEVDWSILKEPEPAT